MSSPYRLRRGEPLAGGIRRVAASRADDALKRLRDEDGDLAERVHEARKDLKKLRSLLRLARAGIGEETYARESAAFRDAGRRLSGARDAEVRLTTLAALEQRRPDGYDGGLDGFRRELEEERRRSREEGDVEAAVPLIAAGRARVAVWSLSGGWQALEPGLRRAYRRGRKALRPLRDEPSDDAVHELRKRVKDLWYHLRLVGEAWSGPLGAAADEAHELSDLLGDHHDLALLAARARASRSLSADGRAALEAEIRTAQYELLGAALPLADRLYAEKPKAFARRLGAYWRASQG